ncbi:hypothetical protein JMJ35_000119 [Cladonia borealis]|uniref:Ankyrin n=1 Tax=Cladonia borealis TaxID=184061 RepID=A0AA39RAM9_9LECA|nr:hypothetical protein JMJ35_000119 [Cladonia borealis]
MSSDTEEETIEQASAAGNLTLVQDWVQRLSVYRGTALEESMLQSLEFSLAEAGRHGHPAKFSYLLDQGLPIDKDVIGSAKSVENFQALLEHGWDINFQDLGGSTSLRSSKNLKNADVVRWLLEHGAHPNIRDRRGYTALDYASYKYSLEVVKLLVQHGADIKNTSAIHGAVANSIKFVPVNPGCLDIVTYLLECGADINQLWPIMPDVYERPHITPSTGTPLHSAVEGENPESVRYLLSRGADRSIKGYLGMTPLEVAESDGLDEIAVILREK